MLVWIRSLNIIFHHFVYAGQPADLLDETNPDWIPTLELGHGFGKSTNVNCYLRLQQKPKETATNEPGFESAQKDHANIDIENTIPDAQIQTDMTSSYISQLEDVVNNLTAENANLKHDVLKKDMFSEEYFQAKPDRVKYYTGLPNFVILVSVLNLISKNLNDSRSTLSKFKQLVLTLMRLRLNLPVYLLRYVSYKL